MGGEADSYQQVGAVHLGSLHGFGYTPFCQTKADREKPQCLDVELVINHGQWDNKGLWT